MRLFQLLGVKYSCSPFKPVCQPVSCEAEEGCITDACTPSVVKLTWATLSISPLTAAFNSVKIFKMTHLVEHVPSAWQYISWSNESSRPFILDHREWLGIQGNHLSISCVNVLRTGIITVPNRLLKTFVGSSFVRLFCSITSTQSIPLTIVTLVYCTKSESDIL